MTAVGGERKLTNGHYAAAPGRIANPRGCAPSLPITLRGQAKVNTQLLLFCLVHNIEKLTRNGWRG